jgi:hypothetical protein
MAEAFPAGALTLYTEGEPVEDREGDAVRQQARHEFLETAKKRWRLVSDVEATLREAMLDDLRFLQPGGQWPDAIKKQRSIPGQERPCLEVDKLSQPIKQVINQARQTRPGIRVSPQDDFADPEVAEVLQGMCRVIEVNSDADVAYDTSVGHEAKMGRGWLRVVTEYESEESFNQVAKIKRVRNPFSIYMDPSAVEFDGSDARYAFVIEDLTQEEFDARYGEGSAAKSLTEFETVGNRLDAAWYPKPRVRVAEYFYREDEDATLVETEMGPRLIRKGEPVPLGMRSRKLRVPRIKWALICANDVLDGNEDRTAGRDWPGRWIPIVPVIGDEVDIDGVVDYQGITRKAKDAQRMANFWKSSATEMIALAPRAPFIAAEGQFEGHEVEWKQANVRNFPYLEYKPVSLAGTLAPPPQRQVLEPPIQAIMIASQQNENDIRAVTGYVDVQAAENRSEVSGRAILARQKQSELGNSDYIDNLGRAIRHLGRILIDLIPRLYDVPRIVRILGLDDKSRAVMVHAGQQGGAPPQQQLPPGVEGIFDLSVGKYDVTVNVGPSHQSKREEAVEGYLALAQAAPPIVPLTLDIAVKNMDWPGADELSERLKKALPPQLQDEPEDGPPPIPPQVQQQLMQMDQMIQALTGALNEAKDALASKEMELTSREKIAQINAQTQIAIAESKTESAEAIALLGARMSQIETELEIAQKDREMRYEAAQAEEQADREDERAEVNADREDKRAKEAAKVAKKQPAKVGA